MLLHESPRNLEAIFLRFQIFALLFRFPFLPAEPIYSAPKLNDGRLSTVIERTLKSWLDLWDWIKRGKEDRGWKIIEMRVLERMACVGKNGFARKTCFSVAQGFERWLARWVVDDAETIASSTVKLLNFSLLV